MLKHGRTSSKDTIFNGNEIFSKGKWKIKLIKSMKLPAETIQALVVSYFQFKLVLSRTLETVENELK